MSNELSLLLLLEPPRFEAKGTVRARSHLRIKKNLDDALIRAVETNIRDPREGGTDRTKLDLPQPDQAFRGC